MSDAANPSIAQKTPFTVGAIGHRSLSEDREEAIARKIATVLDHIMAQHPRGTVGLVSSLAEGADRHFVIKSSDLGLPYDCVLPCSPDCFREDFDLLESRDEFDRLLAGARSVIQPEANDDKESGYLWASEAVLDRADVLVAVWDGRAGNGAAGTAATVARAVARGIPVTWISTIPPHVTQTIDSDTELPV